MNPSDSRSGHEVYAGLLEALTRVLGLARSYLRDHGPRAALLARRLAVARGCPPDEVARIFFAGVLADLGMIGVAEDAWDNPSPTLDRTTRRRVRLHPERSEAILEAIPYLEHLGGLVRHHHEWWDGMGYPDGLQGRGIPLGARILRLADSVAALLEDRPHRPAFDSHQTLAILRQGAGCEFDPELTTLFMELHTSGRLDDLWEEDLGRITLEAAHILIPGDVPALPVDQLLEILAALVDAKDPYTAGHSRRVAVLGVAVATHMGLPDEERAGLWAGGYLHDLGKLGIPLRILAKPGRLDPTELASVQDHPGLGAGALEEIPALRFLVPAARSHHERWDGGGYPDGLSGQGIPLMAQVLGVVDAYDAMTTSRAYRPPLSHEAALKEIAAESGRQFSPEVAQAFLTLPEAFFRAFQQPGSWTPEPFADPQRRAIRSAWLSSR